MLNIAVEGCCHGELDTIYSNIKDYEIRTNRIVDLLLICGDFECVRDKIDLECLGITFSLYCCKLSSPSRSSIIIIIMIIYSCPDEVSEVEYFPSICEWSEGSSTTHYIHW